MDWRGDERDENARIILYLRISDLTDTSTSIERQFKQGCGRAEQIGGIIVQTYRDVDKSGFHTYVERPGFDKALQDLRNRAADVLIVFKVDRATRQGIPQAAEIIRIVYETGCRFISIADGIDSRNMGWELQLTIAAHQAHTESKNTSTRVADLRVWEREAGRWMGHRPYGHIVTPERRLVPHPIEANRVRTMARMLILGASRRAVARYANRRGWDSPRWASRKARIAELEAKGEPVKARKLAEKPLKFANSWSETVVGQMMVTPAIVGILPHEGKSYRHSVTGETVMVGEPLITADEYARLCALIGERIPVHTLRALMPASKSVETKRAVRALLVDYLRCAGCGGRMQWDNTLKKKGKIIERYRCGRRAHSHRCPGTTINGPAVERLVFQALITRVGALDHDHPAILAIAERWADQQHPDRARKRAELEHKIRDEEAFLEKLEDEKLNGDMFKDRRGEERFKKRFSTVQARLDVLEAELDEIPTTERLDVSFVDQLPLLLEAFDTWGLAERREFLGLLLERVWVTKARANGVRPSMDRLTFWWVGECKPEGFEFANTVDGRVVSEDEGREEDDVYETEDQAARLLHEERAA